MLLPAPRPSSRPSRQSRRSAGTSVTESTPSTRLRQNCCRSAAPGNRQAMPITATSVSAASVPATSMSATAAIAGGGDGPVAAGVTDGFAPSAATWAVRATTVAWSYSADGGRATPNRSVSAAASCPATMESTPSSANGRPGSISPGSRPRTSATAAVTAPVTAGASAAGATAVSRSAINSAWNPSPSPSAASQPIATGSPKPAAVITARQRATSSSGACRSRRPGSAKRHQPSSSPKVMVVNRLGRVISFTSAIPPGASMAATWPTLSAIRAVACRTLVAITMSADPAAKPWPAGSRSMSRTAKRSSGPATAEKRRRP